MLKDQQMHVVLLILKLIQSENANVIAQVLLHIIKLEIILNYLSNAQLNAQHIQY